MLPVTTKVPSLNWSDASAKPTTPHKDVHAEGIVYRAQKSAFATQNAQTRKIVTLKMTTMLMIMMIHLMVMMMAYLMSLRQPTYIHLLYA